MAAIGTVKSVMTIDAHSKFYEEDAEYEARMNDRWVKIFKSKGIIEDL